MHTEYVFMPTYLERAARKCGLTPVEVSSELNYKCHVFVQRWFNGWDLPNLDKLPPLAAILKVDVRVLAVGWMIEVEPKLESQLRSLLDDAGLTFPSRGDGDLFEVPQRSQGWNWLEQPPTESIGDDG